jgi:hypothetical protein
MQFVRARRLLGLMLLDQTYEYRWSDVMAMIQVSNAGLDGIDVQEYDGTGAAKTLHVWTRPSQQACVVHCVLDRSGSTDPRANEYCSVKTRR